MTNRKIRGFQHTSGTLSPFWCASFLIASSLAASLTTSATANVETAIWVADNAWSYKITYMPDFDQRRELGESPGGQKVIGFPKQGNMYCAPTSTANLIAYMGYHGYPSISIFDLSLSYWQWQMQSHYNDSGWEVLALATEMGTDPATGTTGGACHDATQVWLENAGLTDFFDVHARYLSQDGNVLTIADAAEFAIDGALVAIAYGGYEYSMLGELLVLGDRVSGHQVSFSRGAQFGSSLTLGVRDPADEPDFSSRGTHLLSQSPFGTRYFDAVNKNAFICTSSSCVHPVTTLNFNPDGNTVAIVDYVLAIAPKQGYSFSSVDQSLTITYGPTPSGIVLESGVSHDVSEPGQLVFHAIAAPGGGCYYTMGIPVLPIGPTVTGVRKYDPATGESSIVTGMQGAFDMVVTPNDVLAIATLEEVVLVDPVFPDKPIATAELHDVANAIAYMDSTNELVVVSADDETIMFLPADFEDGFEAVGQALPAGMNPSGPISVATDPIGGGNRIWIALLDHHEVWYINHEDLSGGTLPIPEPLTILSIDVGSNGNILIGTADGLVEMNEISATEWAIVPKEKMIFQDLPIGDSFKLCRSSTNYDPAIHNTPGWNTNMLDEDIIQGTVVQDCIGDFDGNGIIGAEDLATLLGGWGLAGITDLDQSGITNAADLALLLGAWGPCP